MHEFSMYILNLTVYIVPSTRILQTSHASNAAGMMTGREVRATDTKDAPPSAQKHHLDAWTWCVLWHCCT